MEGKNKTVVYMSRGFGLIMLPLLALMTVGIFRRVDDYGITVLRGYLIVINIWLYGVCVYQFITKARRVKWIIISFAAIALLSSVRVFGVPDVTKRMLTAEIRECLGNSKVSLADIIADGKQVDSSLLKTAGAENKVKAAKKIRYLRETFGFESVKPFFKSDVNEENARAFERLWEWDYSPKSNHNAEDKKEVTVSLYNSWRKKQPFNIKGYDAFACIEYLSDNEKVRNSFKNNQFTIVCDIGGKEKTFNIPLKE